MKNKSLFLMGAMMVLMLASRSQQKQDTVFTMLNIPAVDCPVSLLEYANAEIILHKSAFFIFNESLHPLGKYEFMDSSRKVKYLNKDIRMNRCTLVYIDSGIHRFHTMYQLKGQAVLFKPGQIYMAVLSSRTVWPLPFTIKRKDDKGEEYGPVLLHYISGEQAAELFQKLKKKEVIVTQ